MSTKLRYAVEHAAESVKGAIILAGAHLLANGRQSLEKTVARRIVRPSVRVPLHVGPATRVAGAPEDCPFPALFVKVHRLSALWTKGPNPPDIPFQSWD